MWTKDGLWRPGDFNLHYTYDQLSNRPSEEEKIQFIDNLFNTILERANSRANFSDLRGELVDHYVSKLGDKMKIKSGSLFKKEVYAYHQTFGGPHRIVEIANNFFNEKNRLVQRQFWKWVAEKWYLHLVLLIVLYYSFIPLSPATLLILGIVIIAPLSILEIYKYIKNRKLNKFTKGKDSSVHFYFNFKMQVITFLFFPFQVFNMFDLFESDLLAKSFFTIGIYLITWVWYYHYTVCSRRVAPLLDHYKAQMI